MLTVVMLSVIMLNVIMLNVIMLNVIMLNVIMLNVIMLNGVYWGVSGVYPRYKNTAVNYSIKKFYFLQVPEE
jgi:hypothetical protein